MGATMGAAAGMWRMSLLVVEKESIVVTVPERVTLKFSVEGVRSQLGVTFHFSV
jgi:hypothetical protein